MPNASTIEIANVTVSQYHVFTAPQHIAVDANSSTIYLASTTSNLTVIDASTYAVIGRIALPGIPGNDIAVDTRTNVVYVPVLTCINGTGGISNCEGGRQVREVAEIDGINNTVIGELPIAFSGVTIDSSSGVLYASHNGYLLGYNAQSGPLVANVSVGAQVESVAVNARTDMIYVETCNDSPFCDDGKIIGVNGSSDKIQFSIPIAYTQVGNLVVDPTTDTVYALGIIPGVELLSIDGASGTIRYLSILAGCDVYSGTELILVFDPTLNQVYVISNAFMIAIDAGTGHDAYVLNVPGALSGAVSPDGLEIYLAMGPASLANIDTGYLLVIPGMANESYVTDFAQLGCHAP